jgi:tellurite resistance protein
VVATTNPVVKNSIGSARGEVLFNETVEAIKVAPSAMLQTYLTKLDVLARKVSSQDDKNFALAAVIAVATADGDVEPPEQQLLQRFKALLGATIDIPPPK